MIFSSLLEQINMSDVANRELFGLCSDTAFVRGHMGEFLNGQETPPVIKYLKVKLKRVTSRKRNANHDREHVNEHDSCL